MTVLLYTLGVVLFVVGLAASIGLHEIGHMVPAKRFGVRVPQYFVGFGPTLWSTKRGETEYGVKAIPLGGFVKLVGMLPPAQAGREPTGRFARLISDAREAEQEYIRPGDEGRLFYQLAWWKKLIVMSGGPVMNLMIAFVLLTGIFGLHGAPEATTTVGVVSDCVVPASQGERKCRPDDPVAPAKQAGFQEGDQLRTFNGAEITSWDQVTRLIRDNGDRQARIGIVRDGEPTTLTTRTTVSSREAGPGSEKFVDVGFLGVSPTQVLVKHGPVYAAEQMGVLTWRTVKALAQMPVKLYGVARTALGLQPRDQDSPMSVVGASRVAGEITSSDRILTSEKAVGFFFLLAGVNLFVGMFNFVPLLPLDGGHIAGALWEAIRRGFARLRRRPDPGYVDVARLLPEAYVVASVFIVMTLLLVYVDLVAPVPLG